MQLSKAAYQEVRDLAETAGFDQATVLPVNLSIEPGLVGNPETALSG